MEKQIKEVQDYFIKKILNNEFEIVNSTSFEIAILIDEIYEFKIWMANGAHHVNTKTSLYSSFMQLDFSAGQKNIIYKNLYPAYIHNIEMKEIAEKLKELAALKAKISKQDNTPSELSFG